MTTDSPAVLQLVQDGLPMVEPIARRLARTMGRTSQSDIDDFIGYGQAALLEAARRFDPALGVSFRTFATRRVEGAMLDGLRKISAVSRRVHEKLSAGSGPAPQAQGGDRDPQRLLANHLAAMAAAQATGVLMQPGLDTQGDFLAVSAKTPAEEAYWRRQMQELIERGITTLPPEEATIIRRHYLEGERFDHIASEMGVSTSKMSRMHTSALERLAKLMRREV
jgi:RNA polymerase sigma factor FliA